MPSESQNLFLAALSPKARDLLVQAATAVELPLRAVLYEADSIPEYAYFITSGIASVVTAMPDGATAEVGLIGREGVVGSLHLLGPAPVSTTCFIQLEATALRVPYSHMQKAFRTSDEIRDRVLEFVQSQTSSLGQLAACHRLHEAEERLARWLLMAQDRTQSDVLHFTQEFLAMMLGARRTTVTLVAGSLQRSGLIEYRRGRVKILDRANLESAACECYRVTSQLFHSLYKQDVPSLRVVAGTNHTRSGD
jgi:CRP-like cAMP-binding protein